VERGGKRRGIFTPFHADGTGRGSHQAAAAALVYDDHDGDVRPRRVIVVGLALVVSLGLWQAEQRAHEPAHGGRAEPELVEGKRTGSSTGANRALTTRRDRVATTPPPLGVLKVLERESAPPGCADSRGVPSRGQMASPERVAVTFLFYDVVPRRGKAERFEIRVVPFGGFFISLNTQIDYKRDNNVFIEEDACYFNS
jgi:hypothetical protein